VEAADKTSLDRAVGRPFSLQAAPTKARKVAAPKAELTWQERTISTTYLAMFAITAAFLALTGLVAWLGT
jgi:hypothetical protein